MSNRVSQFFIFCLFSLNVIANAQNQTVTILSAASANNRSGAVFSITAHVTSSGVPLTGGTVLFTDTYELNGITHPAITLGSAQVQSINGIAGNAVLNKAVGGIGAHIIAATFSGITGYSGSTSNSQTINIDPFYNTATEIIQPTGNTGNYILSSRLSAFGSAPPSGTINFTNTTSQMPVVSVPIKPQDALSQFTLLPTTPANNIAKSGPSIGDFNNDGYQDFAVPATDGFVTILLGSSSGRYTQKSLLSTPNPVSTVIGDFNKDGNADLIVLNTDPTAQISIFLGKGDGTFQSPSIFAQASAGTSSYTMLAFGDFNNDGNLDLVASDQQTDAVIILLGNGNGNFGTPTSIFVGYVFNIAVADLNHDGNQDLVIADDGAADIITLYGSGDGTFGPRTVIPLPSSSVQSGSVMTGDFNGDGNIDIAATDQPTQSIYVFLGDGNGGFASPSTYSIRQNPYFLTVGDFNQDGKIDIISANLGEYPEDYNGNVGVLLNKGDGTFSDPVLYPLGGGQSTFAIVGDLNGDNQVDIAAVVVSADASGTNGLDVLLAGQTNTVQTTPIAVYGCGPQTITASYSGDTNYGPSVSLSSVTLSPTISTTILKEEITPSPVYGQQVQLIATLSPYGYGSASTNGEFITFRDGAKVLNVAPLINGVATLPWTFATTGDHNLSAAYAGGCIFQTANTSMITTSVSKAFTSLTASANVTTGTIGQNIKLTASIQSSSVGQPSGTVTFLSNGQTLGTSDVINGTAAYSTSSLPISANKITAIYSGDINFVGSSSSIPIIITIGNFDFTIQVMSSDRVNGKYGDSPQYKFLVSPVGALSLPVMVKLSATTLPTLNSTFTFSPSSLSLSSGPGTVTLSAVTSLAQINNLSTKNTKSTTLLSRLPPVAFCLLLPFAIFRHRRIRGLLSKSGSILLLLLLSLGGAISLSGCGSGLAPYDYPIVVTATSGNVTHTATVMFHVDGIK